MKSLARRVLIDSFSLFLTAQVIAGLKISNQLTTLLFAGAVFSLLSLIIKPILKIITLPLTLITFGAFSFVLNAIMLYLLTLFVPQIQITAFVFPGINLAGFIIPRIAFSLFFAYIVSSVLLSFIASFLEWLRK